MNFSAFWDSCFAGSPPIAHILRKTYAHRWVRFHTLPESKRYPEDEHEISIVLQRHNTLIDDLATDGSNSILLLTTYTESKQSVSPTYVDAEMLEQLSFWKTVAMHEISSEWGEQTCFWHIFQMITQWKKGCYDALLRGVMEDNIANMMVLSENGKWLYAPYAGGVDIILDSTEMRDMLKQKYSAWLSSHARGL